MGLNNIIKKIIGYAAPHILRNQLSTSVANQIYERGSDRLQNLLMGAFAPVVPSKDFRWNVTIDGRTIAFPVCKGDVRSWQFALSYRWHDRGLRRVESLLLDVLPRDGRLLDIGANMGLRSLKALSQGRPVTMFEPNAGLRPFTERLLTLNALTDFTIENTCVGASEGAVTLYLSPTSYMSSLDSAHASAEGAVEPVETPITTVDRYVEGRSLSFSIAKIDVEGHEVEVLKGAAASLERYRPVLLVEVQQHTSATVHSMLSGQGYLGFHIDDPDKLSAIDAGPPSSPYAVNLLYVPKERSSVLSVLELKD